VRKSLVAVPATLAAALAAASLARAEDPAPAPRTSRTFRFEYRVTLPAPEGTKHLDAWIPLPVEDDHQKVADLSVEARTADGTKVAHEVGADQPYGNRMAHVGIDSPKAGTTFSWTATITRQADEGKGTGPVLDRFKQADVLVPITGRASSLSKEILAGHESDPVGARAKLLYDNVLTTMQYDKQTPGWGKGDFERACDVGKGNCTDFHAKFTGIGRAAGLPVRFTMGIPLSTDKKGAPGGYHCWAHFHDGKTWIPVDISEAQKVNAKDPAKAQWFFGHLDPDRLSLSVGRDLELVPKQKGGPLPFFGYPYVEADGKAVDVPKESRAFAFEDK
jgi:transglutaminase-like putative cysteine protease